MLPGEFYANALDRCATEFGKPVQSVKEITSIPTPGRAVLLVQFEGGLRIKLCISTYTDYGFDSAAPFADSIIGVRFPRVLLRGEGWAAFEWFEGEPVSELPFNSQLVDAATSVLIAIHEAKIEIENDVRASTLRDVHARLQKSTSLLVSQGIITDTDCQLISNIHNALRPETLNIALIHGDFSPANIIVCGNELSVVDNDKMRVHFADYDLARASTFWDEWALCGESFLDTYKRKSRRQFDPVSLRFWEMYDLALRISYRLSIRADGNEFRIMKLRRILSMGIS